MTGPPTETTPTSTPVTTTAQVTSTSSEESSESESSSSGTTTTVQDVETITGSTSSTETTASAGEGDNNANGGEGGVGAGGGGGGGQSSGGGGNQATTIGIAVGVSLGVVGLLALFGGYWFYRKSQRNRAVNSGGEAGSYPSKAELGDSVGGETKSPVFSKTGDELDENPVAEIQSPDSRHEMYAGHSNWPAELSAERAEPPKGSR